MNTTVKPNEPYILKSYPPLSEITWKTLSFFSNNQIDPGIKYLEQVLVKEERAPEPWLVGFDFCRLSNSKETLSTLTERYASIFNRPPPDWISNQVEAVEVNTSKGSTLNVLSMSNPESEQYGNAFTAALDKKTAVLLKFNPSRALSWQATAVQRLAKGIESCRKAKIPVYIEHPEVVTNHLKTIPPDQRTEHDWAVLFYFLLVSGSESAFENEALQFTLVQGVSPPSFEKLNDVPMSTWFSSSESSDSEDTSNIIVLQGSLNNHLSLITQKTQQKLNKNKSVILDLRGIHQADWNSIFDIANLHNKVWATGSREFYIGTPTALLHKMFTFAQIPEKSYKQLA